MKLSRAVKQGQSHALGREYPTCEIPAWDLKPNQAQRLIIVLSSARLSVDLVEKTQRKNSTDVRLSFRIFF